MDSSYSAQLAKTLEFEGGYTEDTGGRTNLGITQTTLNQYTKKHGLPKMDVTQLGQQDAAKIYYDEYYAAPGFNTLPSGVGGVLFDYGVNSGPSRAIKAVQSIVGAEVDGQLGPQTRALVENYIAKNGESTLVNKVLDEREAFVTGLATKDPKKYGAYLKGWKARIAKQRPKGGE